MPAIMIISPDLVLSWTSGAPEPKQRRASRKSRKPSSFFSRRMHSSRAAAVVGATLAAGLGAIELARAFTMPQHDAGVFSAVLVTACFATALALLTSHASRIALTSGTTLALLAHGVTLSLGAEKVGPLFAGLAPVLAGLAHATIAPKWVTNLESALDAARAASRNRRAMRA